MSSLSDTDAKAAVVVDHLATLTAQNYLTSVLSELKSLTPPKSTDIPQAFKQLFDVYQVKVGDSLSSKDDSKTRDNVRKVCEADLSESDRAYYGEAINFQHAGVAEAAPAAAGLGLPSLSFLGPYGTAFDAIVGIIGPVFIDFSNIAAQAKQKQAVKEFLDQNKEALRAKGEALGRMTSDYLFSQRLSLAGQFAEQIASVKAMHVDLAKIDACQVDTAILAKRSDSGAPNDAFIICYSTVWSQYSKLVEDALKTASAYDQLADAGDTNTALANYMKIFNHYDEVVQWSSSAEDIWASVTQLITFAGAIANATSGSNLTAIKKAIDALK
ncbi:MAG: hypothetical protein WDN46_00175 [Methylocella sp.]